MDIVLNIHHYVIWLTIMVFVFHVNKDYHYILEDVDIIKHSVIFSHPTKERMELAQKLP